jgi:hypothetical protein
MWTPRATSKPRLHLSAISALTTDPVMDKARARIPFWLVFVGVVAVAFGFATLKEGASVLFFDGPARAAAGNYVPFVLWFNFFAGFAYVAAGAGIVMRRLWGARLAAILAVATAMGFVLLGAHIAVGGAYESRTVVAMAARTLFWSLVAWRACAVLRCAGSGPMRSGVRDSTAQPSVPRL